MSEGLRLVQGAGKAGFSVLVFPVGGAFEYEIKDRANNTTMQEVAEILFSVALDIQAKEAARTRN